VSFSTGAPATIQQNFSTHTPALKPQAPGSKDVHVDSHRVHPRDEASSSPQSNETVYRQQTGLIAWWLVRVLLV